MKLLKQQLTKQILRVVAIAVSIAIDIYIVLQIQPYQDVNVTNLFILLIIATIVAMFAFALVPPIEVGLSRTKEPIGFVIVYIVSLVIAFLISDSFYEWGIFFGLFLPTTYTLVIIPFDITELIPSNRILLLIGYAATRGVILFVYLYIMGLVTL